MGIQLTQSSEYEQTVINIVRKLPSEHVLQLIEFAKFLEFQSAKKISNGTDKTETEDEISISEEKWNQLFAKPEALRVLREMAKEALEDYHTGKTTDISLTEDGRLSPA
jgi:hypothetical protein